jgi:SAM-dependent methyltransferase
MDFSMSEIRFNGSSNNKLRAMNPYWGEHVARYNFAQKLIEGKRVLDVACGTGFGLPFLSAKAGIVIGVDLEWEAASQANREASSSSTWVLIADGCRLPFPNQSFDIVTSFETLEHLETREEFLTELRRVIKPNGLCLLSTPNANYTQPIDGKPRNPFHVFEYAPATLFDELGRYFTIVDFLGQTLNNRFVIPPFQDAQNRLPHTARLQTRLFCWRLLNKLPVVLRESLSQMLWQMPFYPGETDYEFTEQTIDYAPVLIAVCRRDDLGGQS